MSRMIDRAREGPWWDWGTGQPQASHALHSVLDETPEVFLIENVVKYRLDREMGRESMGALREQYPCVAPPFPAFWMEWFSGMGASGCHCAGASGVGIELDQAGWAAVLQGYESMGQGDGHKIDFGWSRERTSRILAAKPRWLLLLDLVTEKPKGRFAWMGTKHFVLDESGAIADVAGERPDTLGSTWYAAPRGVEHSYPDMRDYSGRCGAQLNSCLLAISFLHCKNVQTHETRADAKLQRARRRRGRKPFVTYKVLSIDPIGKILDREGEAHEKGLPYALHICRGHFKDYRQRGLFGRNYGIYWWESAVRGHPSAGEVRKDYRVLSPTDGDESQDPHGGANAGPGPALGSGELSSDRA